MVLLCRSEEIRSNGAYKRGGSTWWSVIITVHCGVGEVGPNSSFSDFSWSDRQFHEPQLAGKSSHWTSLFWWLICWIWPLGGPPWAVWGFLCTRSLILKGKVHLGHTCWAIMSALGAPFSQLSAPWPPLGGFLMMGMSNIRVFALYRMVEIKWRERDCKLVWDASLRDEGVRDTLSRYGLLKFMWILLMQSLGLLLQILIIFWDVTEEVFLF